MHSQRDLVNKAAFPVSGLNSNSTETYTPHCKEKRFNSKKMVNNANHFIPANITHNNLKRTSHNYTERKKNHN